MDNPEAGWTMQPYDTAAITDEQRSERGVPSLEKQRERLRTMNERLERLETEE
jgi:hypothetical protein